MSDGLYLAPPGWLMTTLSLPVPTKIQEANMPMECGHPKAFWIEAEPSTSERKTLHCAVCFTVAAAYAKGASDGAKRALEIADVGCYGHHDKACSACAAWDYARALPIPAAQPRDLSRLWELVEHWKSEGKRCYDLANSKPSKVEQTVMAQSVRFWNCADELAAILKEMEGSR